MILFLCVTLCHYEWSFLAAYAKVSHAYSFTVIAKNFYLVSLAKKKLGQHQNRQLILPLLILRHYEVCNKDLKSLLCRSVRKPY